MKEMSLETDIHFTVVKQYSIVDNDSIIELILQSHGKDVPHFEYVIDRNLQLSSKGVLG